MNWQWYVRLFASCMDIHVYWLSQVPSILVVVVWKYIKITNSNNAVCTSMVSSFYLPFPYTFPPFKKNLTPLILSSYTYSLTHTFFPIGRTDVPHTPCSISFLSIFFFWHLPNLPYFLHFDFWVIFFLLLWFFSCLLES